MRKEIVETGKNVDAAINSACEKLGCAREDCEWEIIDLPKKAFLGLKTIPAKVKVSIEVPDEKPAVVKPVSKPAPMPEPKPEPERKPTRHAVREEKPPHKPQHDKKNDQKPAEQPRREHKQAEPVKPEPSMAEPIIERIVEQEIREPRVAVTEGFNDKEIAAMDYISSMLTELGLEAKLELFREGSGIYVNVTGDGLGTIIGRRGETLDAIQYLTGLVANRKEGDYLRVTVDCGEYRGKRKETLEALAKRLAAQVLKTNTSKALEPMNPFERRVIHATISRIDGVSSSSTGEEPNRRVVITTPTARRSSFRSSSRVETERRPAGPRAGRDRDREDRGDRPNRRDRGDRGDRRPPRGPSRPPQPVGPPKETPESAAIGGTPIGKLDLE